MDITNKLLYIKIMDYIKEKINNGDYLPEQQIPTEMDFAQLFDVSRITSRRALVELENEGIIIRKKGSGSVVAPVDKKIESIEGKSNNDTIASNIITLLLPHAYESGNLIKTILGTSDYIKDKNYYLSIRDSSNCLIEDENFLKEISSGKIRGIIFYPVTEMINMEFITKLYTDNFPTVIIDKSFEGIPFNCVIADNFNGSYDMTKHLIDLGHERIAFVSNIGIEEASSVRERYMGYCKALKDNDLQIDNGINILNYNRKIKTVDLELYELLNNLKPITAPNHQAFFKEMINKLMIQGVTAIQCVSDVVAVYFIKACLDLGIIIPSQLSIVGFDNIELSGHLEIPLSTVEQDFYLMGNKAAEMLIKHIEEGKYDYQKVILPVKLIERRSSGVVNSNIV